MAEIKYEVVKEIVCFPKPETVGQRKSIWSVGTTRNAVYDIRTWSEDKERMGKGITLTTDEVKELKKVLNSLDV